MTRLVALLACLLITVAAGCTSAGDADVTSAGGPSEPVVDVTATESQTADPLAVRSGWSTFQVGDDVGISWGAVLTNLDPAQVQSDVTVTAVATAADGTELYRVTVEVVDLPPAAATGTGVTELLNTSETVDEVAVTADATPEAVAELPDPTDLPSTLSPLADGDGWQVDVTTDQADITTLSAALLDGDNVIIGGLSGAATVSDDVATVSTPYPAATDAAYAIAGMS